MVVHKVYANAKELFSTFQSDIGQIDDEDDDKLSPLLHKERPPFFLKGKFEHCKWEDPNTVFVTVINDFCQQLLRREDPVLTKRYRDAIKKTMRDDINLLTNLVPLLGAILKTTKGGVPFVLAATMPMP